MRSGDHGEGPTQSEVEALIKRTTLLLETTKSTLSLHNQFDPFRRLPNAPFSTTGRPRARSVDSFKGFRPLPAIYEAAEADE